MRTRFSGARAWWVQRASAAYMLLFLLFALGTLGLYPPRTFAAWRTGFAHPGVSIAVLAFFAALFSHMWVGLRDVLLDYARPTALRRALLAVVAAGLLGMAAWVLRILLLLWL